jgi:hypothetical protein
MADILISCPETGRPVPTGLTTDMIILENLPPVAVPLRCRRAGTCTHGTGGRLGSQRPETRSLSLGRSRRSSSWSFRMPAAGGRRIVCKPPTSEELHRSRLMLRSK